MSSHSKADGEGFEVFSASANKAKGLRHPTGSGGAKLCAQAEIPQELARIAKNWNTLPDDIKQVITLLVSSGKNPQGPLDARKDL